MSVELSPSVGSPTVGRARLPAISWPAIFAALAVGIAVQLLLSLAGVALGVYAFDSADEPGTITLAAASWGAASMLVTALVGGYVAGRCSGFRRTGDGVLHGIVSWAATTLLYAALATTALGSLTTGLFGMLNTGLDNTVAQAAVGGAGDRDRAVQALTDLGFSADNARSVLDQMAGGVERRAPGEVSRDSADAVGSATLWLCAAVLLSLLLGMLGGMLGVRGSRRIIRRTDRSAAGARPRILSKL